MNPDSGTHSIHCPNWAAVTLWCGTILSLVLFFAGLQGSLILLDLIGFVGILYCLPLALRSSAYYVITQEGIEHHFWNKHERVRWNDIQWLIWKPTIFTHDTWPFERDPFSACRITSSDGKEWDFTWLHDPKTLKRLIIERAKLVQTQKSNWRDFREYYANPQNPTAQKRLTIQCDRCNRNLSLPPSYMKLSTNIPRVVELQCPCGFRIKKHF